MEQDPLARLLNEADAAALAPTPIAGLADRVRRTAQRRRTARTGIAVALLVTVAASSTWVSRQFNGNPKTARDPIPVISTPTLSPTEIAQLHLECARQDAEANLHERTARAMLSRERLAIRPDAGPVRTADPVDVLATQRERSALILLSRGDRFLREPDAKAQAADTFKRVVELFPQSRGAALARERLDRIGA